MHICKKCKKPLYGIERGNIEIAIPTGYQHKNCSLSIHIDKEIQEINEEIQRIDEDVVENEISTPEENSFLYNDE
jgi:hypothetical protein